MARVSEFSRCSICGGELNRPYTGLPDGARGMPKELWNYLDSVVHLDCFEQWEYRKTFSEKCFEDTLQRQNHPSHGMGYVLIQQPLWALTCGPVGRHTEGASDTLVKVMRQISGWRADRPEPLYTAVISCDWVFQLRSNWFDWDEFINRSYQGTWLTGQALIDAEAIMNEVRAEVPDLNTLYRLLQQQMDSNLQE